MQRYARTPFRFMLRTTGLCLLLSLAATLGLCVTASTSGQFIGALVVGCLLCVLSFLVGLARALTYQARRDSHRQGSTFYQHYPNHARFQRRMNALDKRQPV
jgi:uncharacterized membrane protein YjgN (DUF898 family)